MLSQSSKDIVILYQEEIKDIKEIVWLYQTNRWFFLNHLMSRKLPFYAIYHFGCELNATKCLVMYKEVNTWE